MDVPKGLKKFKGFKKFKGVKKFKCLKKFKGFKIDMKDAKHCTTGVSWSF